MRIPLLQLQIGRICFLLLLVSLTCSVRGEVPDTNDYEDEPISDEESIRKSQDKDPYLHEGEVLSKLQQFLSNGINNVIKDALPLIVRSGIETNVSTECSSAMLSFINGLRVSEVWAIKMLDASGKMPSGILDGTLTDLGAFEQCLETTSRSNVSSFRGQYCLLDLRASFENSIPWTNGPPPGIKPTDLVWENTLRIFWSRNHLLSFRYGACIPSSCSQDDLDQLMNFFAEPSGMEADIHSCQIEKPGLEMDLTQKIILSLLSAIITLVLMGTCIEYFKMAQGIDLKKVDKNGRSISHFLTRFSIHRNTKLLLGSPVSGQLRHLDGMRTITAAWIILGHTYFYTDLVHYAHYRKVRQLILVDDNPILIWLSNFTFSVDTFFCISGVLLIVSSWKKLEKTGGSIGMISFLFHRVYRIWPAYLTTIGLVLILPVIGSGPLWPLAVDNTATLCRSNWWYNIFFLNNFQKPDQLCLLHTWYLSASVQFHIVGGFVLYAMYRSPRVGISICAILTAISSGASFYYAYHNEVHTPSVIAYEVFADAEQKILTLYMLPFNHLGSYLTGILIGYFLVTQKERVIPRVMQGVIWLTASVVGISSIAGPFEAFRSNLPSLLMSGMYYALARTCWSWSIGWLIFACATGRGGPITHILSWKVWNPLSSLSYLAYLVHPILMLFHTGRIRERIYFGHYELVNIFVSRLVFSFLLAYFIHVMVEVPFAAIEVYIFGEKKAKTKSTDERITSPSSPCNMNGINNNLQTSSNLLKITPVDHPCCCETNSSFPSNRKRQGGNRKCPDPINVGSEGVYTKTDSSA